MTKVKKYIVAVAMLINIVNSIPTRNVAQNYRPKVNENGIPSQMFHPSHIQFHQPQYLIEHAGAHGQFHRKDSSTWTKRQEEGEVDGKEASSQNESNSGENSKDETTPSPLDQTIQALTTPEQLLPIINDLTFIALLILFLPVTTPTILIPLAFFAVGSFLIPIVRVNYFINHVQDDDDGRSFMPSDNLLDRFLSFFHSNTYRL